MSSCPKWPKNAKSCFFGSNAQILNDSQGWGLFWELGVALGCSGKWAMGSGSGEWVVAYTHSPLPTAQSPCQNWVVVWFRVRVRFGGNGKWGSGEWAVTYTHSALPTPHYHSPNCNATAHSQKDRYSSLEPKFLLSLDSWSIRDAFVKSDKNAYFSP